MKKGDFQKFIIGNLSDTYGYNITEINSKDDGKVFWALSKIEDNKNTCLVFLNREDIDIVEDNNDYEKFIRVIILNKDENNSKLEFTEKEADKIILVDQDKNNIVYCPEELQGIGAQIYSILHYKSRLEERKNKKSLVTISLIGINIIMYVITAILSKNVFESNINVLIRLGAKVNSLIATGEYYRLFTCMFLHGGLLHIGFNMYALYVLGPFIEEEYGKMKYLIIYFISGVISSIFSYAFSGDVSIGASGAIFGLLGAYLVFAINMKDKIGKELIFNIVVVIVANVLIGLSINNIDNFGHLGGLLGGVAVAFILSELSKKKVS